MSCGTERVITNPTIVCLNGAPALVAGCAPSVASAPQATPGCCEPRVNPFVNGGEAYTAGQAVWTAADPKPATLIGYPPQFAQAIYAKEFGLGAIPSTAIMANSGPSNAVAQA